MKKKNTDVKIKEQNKKKNEKKRIKCRKKKTGKQKKNMKNIYKKNGGENK